jgi:hypothetical protein
MRLDLQTKTTVELRLLLQQNVGFNVRRAVDESINSAHVLGLFMRLDVRQAR